MSDKWPIIREVTIGPCRLIQGDCLEVMPLIGRVDAVVTDPPYGIGETNEKNSTRSVMAMAKDYGHFEWDSNPASAEHIDAIRSISEWQIIFGGNYFQLPPAKCWLVWDKENGNNDFADCELAWTNLQKAVRRILWLWHGMIRKGNEERFHPTQKPVGVMEWCINHLPNDVETILDPFAGSGTTGVACIRTERRFIGIEKEERYFRVACERIQRAWDLKCSELPFEEPPKQIQRELI